MGDITSTGNQTIWDEGANYSAEVTSDGELLGKTKIYDGTNEVSVTNNKLDVNAEIVPPKYTLRFEANDTDIDFVGDTWYTVFDINDEGKPYSLKIEFYNSDWQVKITMDGVEVFNMTNSEMGNFGFNTANATKYIRGMPYRYANDSFVWHFPDDITFDTEFKVEVKRRSGKSAGFDAGSLVWGKKY